MPNEPLHRIGGKGRPPVGELFVPPKENMNVVLISCVAKKKPRKCKAKDLYDSTWFRYAWSYAQSLNPDKVFILSAKYGLVDPEAEIEPYEETLNTKTNHEIFAWADTLLTSLRERTDVTKDTFVILAGEKYRTYLVGNLPNHDIPMEGMRIGQQLKWFKERCTQ